MANNSHQKYAVRITRKLQDENHQYATRITSHRFQVSNQKHSMRTSFHYDMQVSCGKTKILPFPEIARFFLTKGRSEAFLNTTSCPKLHRSTELLYRFAVLDEFAEVKFARIGRICLLGQTAINDEETTMIGCSLHHIADLNFARIGRFDRFEEAC